MTDFGSPAASQSTEINAVELHQREPCKRRRTQTFIQTRCGDARFQAVFCLFILFSQRSHSFSASRLVPLPFMPRCVVTSSALFMTSFSPPNPPTALICHSLLYFSLSLVPAGHPHFLRYAREKKRQRGKKKKRQNELEV